MEKFQLYSIVKISDLTLSQLKLCLNHHGRRSCFCSCQELLKYHPRTDHPVMAHGLFPCQVILAHCERILHYPLPTPRILVVPRVIQMLLPPPAEPNARSWSHIWYGLICVTHSETIAHQTFDWELTLQLVWSALYPCMLNSLKTWKSMH